MMVRQLTFATLLLAMLVPLSANAQPRFCNLALVLAMDASSSVDDREYQLQMKGTARALLDPEIHEAIDLLGGMYIAAFEWNGRLKQKSIFEWTYLKSGLEAVKLAGILANHVRNATNAPTALGAALGHAHRQFQKVPQPCGRYVIDVAGDGVNNDGIIPADVYQLYDFSNIQVNGLVIKDIYTSAENFYRDPEGYYRRNVIRGPGAFLVLAHGFDDYAKAIKQKLLKEIIPGPIGELAIPDKRKFN